MAASTVSIKWGTQFRIFNKDRLISKLPSSSDLKPTASNRAKDACHPVASLSPFNVERIAGQQWNSKLGFPSVTCILGCTDQMEALYRWQKLLISQMGEARFNRYMTELLSSSTKLHAMIARLLKEFARNPKVVQSDDEILEKTDVIVRPYVESLLPLLRRVKLPDDSEQCIEKSFLTERLFYTGKFDAIVEIDGQTTLVDWKKVSEGKKNPAQDENGGTTLDGLYSAPLQIAAYIFSVNSSSHFSFLKKQIEKGAIIQVSGDGNEPKIIPMSKEEIEHNFQLFLDRLNRFWYTVESAQTDDKSGIVDFVYRPPDDEDKTSA